jgi:hypothetical protein
MNGKQQNKRLVLRAGQLEFLIEDNSIEVSASLCPSANSEIMGLAKLLLGHYLSGIDITTDQYQSGLEYAVETIVSDCGAEGQYLMRSA